MKGIASSERARTWVVDYSAARARAIEWLGDRYLLARPINARESGWHKGAADASPFGAGHRRVEEADTGARREAVIPLVREAVK